MGGFEIGGFSKFSKKDFEIKTGVIQSPL